jgi:hypothetical protein
MPPVEKVVNLPILSQTELMGGGSSAAGGSSEQNPEGTAPIFSMSFFYPTHAALVRPMAHPVGPPLPPPFTSDGPSILQHHTLTDICSDSTTSLVLHPSCACMNSRMSQSTGRRRGRKLMQACVHEKHQISDHFPLEALYDKSFLLLRLDN